MVVEDGGRHTVTVGVRSKLESRKKTRGLGVYRDG